MSIENLSNEKALEKMRDLVKDIGIAMLLTDLNSQPISAAPMSTKRVDKEGNIWFLSGLNSDHNVNIVKNRNVQLLYSDPSDMEFISIYGEAVVTTDQPTLKDLYSKVDDTWFKGVDDPNLTAIKVNPKEAYFWDTKQNKYITLFKMGLSTITGKQSDTGEKGRLDL